MNLKELSKYKILCKDGEIGEVSDFYFDENMWTVRYIIVNTGNWIFKNLVLISPIFVDEIIEDKKEIKLELTKEQVEKSPDIDTKKPVSRQNEINLMDHFGAGYYWSGFNTWGAYPIPLNLRGLTGKNKKNKKNENIYLRSMNEVLGYKVAADNGDFGRFNDMVMNKDNWSIDYFVLNTNVLLPGEEITFNIRWVKSISLDEKTVQLYSTKDAAEILKK